MHSWHEEHRKNDKICLRTLFIYDWITGINSRCFPSDSVKGKTDAQKHTHIYMHLCTFSINVSRLSLHRFYMYERQGRIWAASMCLQTPIKKFKWWWTDNCDRIPTLQLAAYFFNQKKSIRMTHELLQMRLQFSKLNAEIGAQIRVISEILPKSLFIFSNKNP